MRDAKLNAFVEAACATFETMLGIEVSADDYHRGTGVTTGYDVSGIVGLSNLGETVSANQGSFVLSFPEVVARRAVGRILGLQELPTLDQDVADGIGELVNVIAGLAKRGLAKIGIRECRTSLPNVILGSQHRVFHQRDAHCFAAHFSSEIGSFLLQILLLAPIDREEEPSGRSAPAGVGVDPA
ncbi:MAG: chemotaxis protein CheX [Planctomycetota bacterium]|jgi:chemotaxis protein CheX